MAGPIRGAYTPAMPSKNPRLSMYKSQNLNPLLASASKHGPTPLKSSERTQRLALGGGAGAILPAVNQPVKDPRPLRDRQYQARMRQELVSWLQSANYDISMQILANITAKEYRNIFQYLYSMLDQDYPFDSQARFEDEFITALKCVRYPFVGQIDPKWLAAPASMHSWPSLLGALHWLTVICKARLHYLESEHATLQDPDLVPEEFDDPNYHAALAFVYFSEAYEDFFAGSDNYDVHEQRLEERYAKKNVRVCANLEEQKAELAKVKAELEELQSAPAPIDQLLTNNKFLKRDRDKFQDYVRSWEGRKKTLISHIANLKADITLQTSNLGQLKAEEERLSEVVREQNISPEDVRRMNTEHEQLSRNLEDLKFKIADAQKTVFSLEVAVANRGAAAEEAVDAYTRLLSNLGLFPPLPPPWQDIDLKVELNTAASRPEDLLKGPDVRNVIKPTLNAVIEDKQAKHSAVERERSKVDHELDQLISECEDLEVEMNETEKKIIVLNEQADELRELAQREALVTNAEISRLERDLGQARTAALSSGTGIRGRLQALQIGYREQVEKVARLRDETVRAIVKNSTEIAMFKEDISQQLKNLRDFAEAGQ
ncbi:HEC/Ndc80p family-domain-containing protein [Russula dissimulans]|nr:HEC/Ndc80p family-domain-containing protein [Russula dissimulans]